MEFKDVNIQGKGLFQGFSKVYRGVSVGFRGVSGYIKNI